VYEPFEEKIMRKQILNVLIGVLTLAAWTTNAFAVDDPTPSGPPIIIQAEDCVITAISGGYTVGSAPAEWDANTPVVWVATSAVGGLQYGYGEINFAFPPAPINGDYLLSVKWHTGKMNGKAWGYMIDADAGTVTEGTFESGKWHYFYPGKPNTHDDKWFEDYLAGPNGLSFATYANTPVHPYLTLSGIGTDDLCVTISDMAFSKDNYFAIDYFVLQPVTVINKSIHVEAEDCIITAGASGSYWSVSEQWVYMATDASGNPIYGTGIIIFSLPPGVPDDEYVLKMGYTIGSWAGASSAFKIAPASGSGGTIQENGIATQNGWHYFYLGGSSGDYYIDDLAGPDGLSCSVNPSTPIATSVTVSGIGPGEFAISIWDQSAGTYDHFGIDFFELIPVE